MTMSKLSTILISNTVIKSEDVKFISVRSTFAQSRQLRL